jgi:predicted nuclease with TOPRIM domain
MRWVIIVFALMWIGPMMRWIFGSGEDGRRRLRGRRDRPGEVQLEEALETRDQVIEDLQRRISELESRLDFTERLLAEPKEPVRP